METISTSKAGYHTVVNIDKVGALVATDYKDPPTVLRIGGGRNGRTDSI